MKGPPLARRPVARGLLGLVVGFTVSLLVIVAVHRFDRSTDRAPELIGQPDFHTFCQQLDTAYTAIRIANDPYGWRCAGTVARVWGREEVDPGDVCRWQFGEGSQAVLSDPSAADGWACTPG